MQRTHCPPASRSHRRPIAPLSPDGPTLLAFPLPHPMKRTCKDKAQHPGPPTAETLSELCKQEPWPPSSRRHPLGLRPHPYAAASPPTSYLHSSGLPPTSEVMAKVSPALSYPGLFRVTGFLLSLVFRTEDVWQRCNQFIETAEFLRKRHLCTYTSHMDS